MEAWKRFEQSGKVEDYLAYCKDTVQERDTKGNGINRVYKEDLGMGGGYGGAGESNRGCAFG